MIVVLIDPNRDRAQYLYEELKDKYKDGKVYNLASIDKVKEVSGMLKWSRNHGLAEEVDKLWRSYNESIADHIVDFIYHYKQSDDIVLVTVEDDRSSDLLIERIKRSVVGLEEPYSTYIGGAPKHFINDVIKEILEK